MSIDKHDAAIIKGMLLRGDKQSDIAAWFGENSGRIAEVHTGERHPEAKAAPPAELPPPGPYVVVPESYIVRLHRLTSEFSVRRREAQE